jgi:hypothetical protein
MAGDINPPADPDILVLLNVIQKSSQRGSAARATYQPAVQTNAHHLGAFIGLAVQYVERVPQIGKELVAGIKPLIGGKAHVIVVQRIRDNEVWPAMGHIPIWEIVGIRIGVIE